MGPVQRLEKDKKLHVFIPLYRKYRVSTLSAVRRRRKKTEEEQQGVCMWELK